MQFFLIGNFICYLVAYRELQHLRTKVILTRDLLTRDLHRNDEKMISIKLRIEKCSLPHLNSNTDLTIDW